MDQVEVAECSICLLPMERELFTSTCIRNLTSKCLKNINPSKKLALGVSIITMLEAIRIQITMDKEVGGYQKVMSIGWGNQEIGFGMDSYAVVF